MKGSEKQIAWATEIQERICGILETTITIVPDVPWRQDIIDNLHQRIDLIKNADYAGDLIDLFKDIYPSEDPLKDFDRLQAIYHVTIPYTVGQQKILMKK